MAQITTDQIMLPREITRLAENEPCVHPVTLALALWELTDREGYPQYLTSQNDMDILVWRNTNGELNWICTRSWWLRENKLKELEQYLKDHHVRCQRIDDLAHRTVIFKHPIKVYMRAHVHLCHCLPHDEREMGMEAITQDLLKDPAKTWRKQLLHAHEGSQ